MTFDNPMLAPLYPELAVLTAACVVLMVTVFAKNLKISLLYTLAQLGVIAAALLVTMTFATFPIVILQGTFISDGFGRLLKLMILIIVFCVFVYSREYIASRKYAHGEFYTLSLLSLCGMMILVSASNLLVVYLGLELMSLPIYALVALDRKNASSSEAAMKYFVMGALASGMLLFGMSLIYGVAADLNITQIAHTVAVAKDYDKLMVGFGLVFMVVGIAFKLGACPFHMWVPDVYHGAPVSMTLFLGTAPKLAGFAMLIRILIFTLPTWRYSWQTMWMVMAVASIGLGNVAAIAQSNIKRMLAYSSIAHIGYMVLGIVSGTIMGFSASLFYAINYGLMSVAAFGIITLLSNHGVEADAISDLSGLSRKNPWLAFLMMVVMFSMAGIPPTVGFFAKLSVLSSLVNAGYVALAVYALVFAVIGSYYYLRVIKTMYFEDEENQIDIAIEWDAKLIISINALAMLYLGLFPASLMQLCQNVFGIG